VLAHLLDKYAEHGIGQLDDLGILQVPPLSSPGVAVGDRRSLRSVDTLRSAVTELGDAPLHGLNSVES
jgi:hypothetical protein